MSTIGKSESIFLQAPNAETVAHPDDVEKMNNAAAEYNSPDGRTPVEHYMRGGIECIDAMRAISTPAEFQAHCRLTAFKYLWRLGEKDDPLREAKKTEDYVRWLRQSLEENQ